MTRGTKKIHFFFTARAVTLPATADHSSTWIEGTLRDTLSLAFLGTDRVRRRGEGQRSLEKVEELARR